MVYQRYKVAKFPIKPHPGTSERELMLTCPKVCCSKAKLTISGLAVSTSSTKIDGSVRSAAANKGSSFGIARRIKIRTRRLGLVALAIKVLKKLIANS